MSEDRNTKAADIGINSTLGDILAVFDPDGTKWLLFEARIRGLLRTESSMDLKGRYLLGANGAVFSSATDEKITQFDTTTTVADLVYSVVPEGAELVLFELEVTAQVRSPNGLLNPEFRMSGLSLDSFVPKKDGAGNDGAGD